MTSEGVIKRGIVVHPAAAGATKKRSRSGGGRGREIKRWIKAARPAWPEREYSIGQLEYTQQWLGPQRKGADKNRAACSTWVTVFNSAIGVDPEAASEAKKQRNITNRAACLT